MNPMDIKDLHICKDSMKSRSESEESPCDCGPEYYCAYVCGEDYSVSTLISWQHFPRSTSSRSFCDDSSEEVELKSISDTVVPSSSKGSSKSTEKSSTEYPITKSSSQLKALHYLNVRHVFELFNFMMGHLVCNEPEDPVDFLVVLLEKCLRYRDSYGEPPLLFTHSHIQSVYNAFDPFERGCITSDQYKEAMKSLGLVNGITPYNEEPQMNDESCIDESTFVFEAERCLTENLQKMLRIPKIWEEHKSTWERKMKIKEKKLREKEKILAEIWKKNLENNMRKRCTCPGAESQNSFTCKCFLSKNVQNEPEQLFFEHSLCVD